MEQTGQWEVHLNPKGKKWYFNKDTGVTLFEKPSDLEEDPSADVCEIQTPVPEVHPEFPLYPPSLAPYPLWFAATPFLYCPLTLPVLPPQTPCGPGLRPLILAFCS